MIGKKISNFHINECIGQGGMGTVYKATDLSLKRTVAIKMLNPVLIDESDSFKRFENEAQLSAKISHPNVATLYDFIHYENSHCIVMEYVEGKALDAVIKFQGKIPETEVIKIAIQVLEGLGAAHDLGIMHRDLKPGNIMITKRGYVKLMDFGIAKLENSERITRENSVIGTLDYLSPELLKGGRPSKSSDLYSVGMMLFEMITGRSMYTAQTAASLMYQIAYGKQAISLPGCNRKLGRIIKKLIHKQASKRYQTTQAVIADLQSIHQGGKVNTAIFTKKITASKKLETKHYFSHIKLDLTPWTNVLGKVKGFELDMKIISAGFVVGLLVILFGLSSNKPDRSETLPTPTVPVLSQNTQVVEDKVQQSFSRSYLPEPKKEIQFIEKFQEKNVSPKKESVKSEKKSEKQTKKSKENNKGSQTTSKKSKQSEAKKQKKQKAETKRKSTNNTIDQKSKNKKESTKEQVQKEEDVFQKNDEKTTSSRTRKIRVPDTYLSVYFPESISTEKNKQGQTIFLTINKAVFQDEKLVVPKGAPVRTRIKKLRKPQGRKKAYLAIEFEAVQASNGNWLEVSYPEYSNISKTAVTFEAGTQLNKVKLKSTIIKL